MSWVFGTGYNSRVHFYNQNMSKVLFYLLNLFCSQSDQACQIEELLVVHELLLKHSLHKAMKQRPFAQRRKGVWQRPMRAMRSSQALVWPHQSSRGDAVFLTADFETG